MVIGFHAYARWPNLVPYGNQYESLFSMGWLGVQLFFLISGFVILMTLEKCQDFKGFIFRRWLRLFPAMLFCSIIIFVSAEFFHERPAGPPSLISLAPGFLFIEPSWLKAVTGQPINPLEGAFWSLYVEAKFYFIAGILYFSRGHLRMLRVLLSLSVIGFALQYLGENINHPYAKMLWKFAETTSLKHFGWFAAGAAAYLYAKTKEKSWLIMACISSAYCSIFLCAPNLPATLLALAVSGFFILALVYEWPKKILCNPFFQFFGFISYPLYLSHENTMIAAIIKIGSLWPELPGYLYPIIPIIGLSYFSYLCAKYVEPATRDALRNTLTKTYLLKKSQETI